MKSKILFYTYNRSEKLIFSLGVFRFKIYEIIINIINEHKNNCM